MAVTQVAGLDVELRAKTAQFNREMRGAVAQAKKYGTQAKTAKAANDSFAGSFSNAANSVAILDGPLGGVAGRLSSVAAGLRAIGPAGLAAGLGLAAGSMMISKGLAVYEQTQRQQMRTEALLRATGNAAGFTADQLDDMARRVGLATLASTEGIRDAQGVLLTFRSVSGSTFERAITLAQDLAAVMGSDARGAAMMLGKALEDPTKGITAMSRAGVSFNETEKEKIKQLTASNRLLEAQEMILDKLSQQVGGAGEGEAGGLSGKIDTLGQEWSEFNEYLAETSGAAALAESSIDSLTRMIAIMKRGIAPEDKTVLAQLVAEREAIKGAMADAGDPGKLISLPMPFVYDKNDWYNDQRRLTTLNDEIKAIQDRRVEELKAISAAQEAGKLAQERIKSETELAKQIERQAKAEADALKSAQGRAKAKGSLYDKIFGEEDNKPKNFSESNMFGIRAKLARDTVRTGPNLDDAVRVIESLGDFAQGFKETNFDYQGMQDVVALLREDARARFGRSEFDDAAAKRAGGPSSLQFEGAGVSLDLLAKSSTEMAEQVKTWVSENSSREKAAGEMNEKIQTLLKEQQELAKNPPEQKPTKFELTLNIAGQRKTIRGTSGDDIVDQISLERAAAGAE